LADDAGSARDETKCAVRRLAGALTRAAAEPLAADWIERRPEARSPRQMARERLEREIESRGRLLVSTRRRLDGLGFFSHRRHGPALRDQIDDQVRILADLRVQLRDLPTVGLHPRPTALERSPVLEARERPIPPPLERGMGLEL
jgi:hypothetical protein